MHVSNAVASRRHYVPVIGPRLRRLLVALLVAFALLSANAVYLTSITVLEWLYGETYQDWFYQFMFLGHLALGLAILVPVVIYGCIHIANARSRPNRRAVMAGYALFFTTLILLLSGLLLTRGIPLIEVKDADVRNLAYWMHVGTPAVVVWLFILHRLAGPRLRWRQGLRIAFVAVVAIGMALALQVRDPRQWNTVGPASAEQYFFPSLARTLSGQFIPARSLMMDSYCQECHTDTHQAWQHSAHRFASFNNPAYLFSVRNTRKFALARDGNVRAARFCAGCHDPVPFFSGAFDDPQFDDEAHPTAHAGITCSVCHAITHVNSPRGNADYTIEEPQHYPFAFSDAVALQWLNRFLVKAKPALHKKTFLKPLHQTPEFCGTCHKVHLPQALNGYKWLRGQNHYDSFLLSGVSGHGVESFYYPEKPQPNCNRCHMAAVASTDFGARRNVPGGPLEIRDHQFVGANTALPHLLGLPDSVNTAHQEFLRDSVRVDLFGVRRSGGVNGQLVAPLRPRQVELMPGKRYLIEVVVRTLTLGHHFTQGTADSNEVWLDVRATQDGRIIGRSGGLDQRDGSVDPWSHFINAYVLDREGNRIDRRNPEDIFTTLYNHQIPPGASDVIHFAFDVPSNSRAPVEIEVKLNYRKFDTRYLRLIQGDAFAGNTLPVTTIASDRIVLPVGTSAAAGPEPEMPAWERWNDYGIGLLRRSGTGELRQAEHAFQQVEALGRGVGSVNLARVYLREGRLEEAVQALARADSARYPAPRWSVAYFGAVANHENGYLDAAIADLRSLAATAFDDARARGFDFSKDYRLLNRLAGALFDRSKLERGERRKPVRTQLLVEAADWHLRALKLDPENTTALYGLAQIYTVLDEPERAREYRALHARYRVDDNARDRAITMARRQNPAADHAANDVVIYTLHRPGAFELPAR